MSAEKKLEKYYLSNHPVNYAKIKPTSIFDKLTSQLKELVSRCESVITVDIEA